VAAPLSRAVSHAAGRLTQSIRSTLTPAIYEFATHTAYDFQITAYNIQFDAVMDDNGGGENASPDFFWESATHINDHGWTVEIRIPFSSLRYRKLDPQTWGVMSFRN
jgi:hypothetical protein